MIEKNKKIVAKVGNPIIFTKSYICGRLFVACKLGSYLSITIFGGKKNKQPFFLLFWQYFGEKKKKQKKQSILVQ